MASLEPFVLKIKPALDAFLRNPTKDSLNNLNYELSQFNWMQMHIFHAQILLPLVLKLEEFCGENQEMQTGTMNCISLVTSKLYLKDVKGLKTMLVIVLRQIRECESTTTKPQLSEEMKLAAVRCFTEALQRSTTDVLEQFYTNDSVMVLGQILLTLVEFIEKEKYRKLVISSMECLLIVFYVHDSADSMDVVLRSQVANTLFIFLPKIVTILFKICLSDEKTGDTLKALAIKALGRILCVMYEETNEAVRRINYDTSDFKHLIEEMLHQKEKSNEGDDVEMISNKKKNSEQLEDRLKRMQGDGRSPQWFSSTSCKLRIIFVQTRILRSHPSTSIRHAYAEMCCSLMQNCAHNLKDSFIFLLENVLAMSEDFEGSIRRQCAHELHKLQNNPINASIFDETAELLFDEHITKLPRIINRCDEAEQYAELMFLKGFMRNLSSNKLRVLLSMPRNLEMFCMCLLSAVDLKVSRELLIEEYALRQINDADYSESVKLHWRQFKNLSSARCLQAVEEICAILGKTKVLNQIMFDFLLQLLLQQNEAMNEILLIMLWMATSTVSADTNDNKHDRLVLVQLLLDELLSEKHWHLSLQPDEIWRLKVNKPTDWFVDRTPGLYESAVEIRTQDCDSDDEDDADNIDSQTRVTIADAEFNVLHTCIILDALGNCARYLGDSYDRYVFRSLHRVLLKVASNNSMIYQAANFALISMQKALKFLETSHFIETYTDYITYHLNTILKRTPESRSAVDILTVVLQLSTRHAVPHLESIFQTIRDECAKAYQTENINSYLKVFHAFLSHVSMWQTTCDQEISTIPMQVDIDKVDDILENWLSVLHRCTEDINLETEDSANEVNATPTNESSAENDIQTALQGSDSKATLPRHIEMVKDILNQVLKFISSGEQSHQILALECLTVGLNLLRDYENELLPLVHLIWQPLVEKFRQKDAVVLNRCFTLLNVCATHAKEFILKRSLNDVIPFLKHFLKLAAAHSANETIQAQTQEYKLQLKLLQEFANLIQSMQIDGKILNEIIEVVALYLSQQQPVELQEHAVLFFTTLRLYNGPLVYLTLMKKSHLKDYEANVSKILSS